MYNTDYSRAAVQEIVCGGAERYSFALTSSTTGKLTFYLSSNGTSWDLANAKVETSATMVDSTWYHIAIVFDCSTYKVYKNGSEVTDLSVTSAALMFQPPTIRLGADYTGTSLEFTGYYEGFRFTPYARYTANFTAPTGTFTADEVHWFNTTMMAMYKGTPASWTKTLRLFLGEATVSTSSISSCPTYAYQGKYYDDSTTAPNVGTYALTSKTHAIGTRRIKGRVALKCILANAGYSPGDLTELFNEGGIRSVGQDQFPGLGVYWTRTSMTHITGTASTYVLRKDTGNSIAITNGSWKLVFKAERDF